MTRTRPPRDNRLIDSLESKARVQYDGPIWRVVRKGRDVLQGASSGGRWDDGTFDVLYTSMESDGAVAEIHYHLTRGLPVIPSKVHYYIHELKAAVSNSLKFIELSELEDLGLSTEHYGKLSYVERQHEYPRTQEIAEAAYFLGCDGLIVPSARWSCLNLIVFCDRTSPESLTLVKSSGPINWDLWTKNNK